MHLARQRAEASPLGAAPWGSQSRTAFAQIPPPEAAPQPQVARRARPPSAANRDPRRPSRDAPRLTCDLAARLSLRPALLPAPLTPPSSGELVRALAAARRTAGSSSSLSDRRPPGRRLPLASPRGGARRAGSCDRVREALPVGEWAGRELRGAGKRAGAGGGAGRGGGRSGKGVGRQGLASSLSAILWQRDPQIKGSAGVAARRRSAGAGGGGAVGRPGRREDSAGSAYVTGRAPARPPSGEVGAGRRRPQRRRGPPSPQEAEVRLPGPGRGQLSAGGGFGVPGPPGLPLAPPSAR